MLTIRILAIQRLPLNLEGTQYIPPLAVRDFITHSIPFQFSQDRIFQAGQYNLPAHYLLILSPFKLLCIV